jgi:hypothetical protein
MLYVIGGAPRSGKSLLAKRILKEKQISYFPVDAITGTLSRVAPEYGINHDLPFTTKAEKIWKFVESLLEYFFGRRE